MSMIEWPRWMHEPLMHLAQSPIAAIVLTIAAYLAGTWVFRKMRHPVWCPPILISAMLTAAILAVLPLSITDYQHGAEWVSVLLGPATVALGVPLYQQIHHIRALWLPLLATVPLAASLACLYAVGLAWLMGGTPEVLLSLAPKSVTAPIAIGITEHIGGSLSLMMGGLLVTGVVATMFVSLMAPRLGETDERIIGFVLGINGHAIGTVHAFSISPLAGAFSSLGMGLTGIFTALCLPLAIELIQ